MIEKTCKSCAIRYHDGFCMQNCTYMGDNDKCQKWSDKPLGFDYNVLYRLCRDYIKLCKDYEEYKQLCEQYPDERKFEILEPNYEFFFNCCINDLHRELSLWKTKR